METQTNSIPTTQVAERKGTTTSTSREITEADELEKAFRLLKRAIIILVFLSGVIHTQGQTLNLQLGASFSKLFNRIIWKEYEDELYLNNNLTGFNATAGIDYCDHKYFNLSSNVGFLQKGGKDTVYSYDAYGNIDSIAPYIYRFNYITLNTGFVFKVPIKHSLIPYIIAGPRLDYLVSYQEKNHWGQIESMESCWKLNRFIFGLLTGVGINYKINKLELGVVFNYYINFNKIWDWDQFEHVELHDTGLDRTFTLSDRTFTINFQIGYKL
jgi:hypothetical protein